VGNKLFWS